MVVDIPILVNVCSLEHLLHLLFWTLDSEDCLIPFGKLFKCQLPIGVSVELYEIFFESFAIWLVHQDRVYKLDCCLLELPNAQVFFHIKKCLFNVLVDFEGKASTEIHVLVDSSGLQNIAD